MIKLKPCPFCNCEVTDLDLGMGWPGENDKDHTVLFGVICPGCGIGGPRKDILLTGTDDYGCYQAAVDDAIALWNARPEEKRLRAELEAANKKITELQRQIEDGCCENCPT